MIAAVIMTVSPRKRGDKVKDTVENDKGNDGWTVIPLGVYRIVAFLPRPDEDQ
jgi:hypothetical protein